MEGAGSVGLTKQYTYTTTLPVGLFIAPLKYALWKVKAQFNVSDILIISQNNIIFTILQITSPSLLITTSIPLNIVSIIKKSSQKLQHYIRKELFIVVLSNVLIIVNFFIHST